MGRVDSRAAGRSLADDRDFRGTLVYGVGLGATAVLAYVFNAVVGRRLPADDFASFGALLGILLALSGAVSALYGGAAMAASLNGAIEQPRWRAATVAAVAISALGALLPVSLETKSVLWFAAGMGFSMLLGWNRGLLTGLGRLPALGGTMIFEGIARIGLTVTFLALGWGLVGAAAGMALGIGAAVVLTSVLLPRSRAQTRTSVGADVWMAVAGLLVLGFTQFGDVSAVRIGGSGSAGAYAAAASIARLALFAQMPAAAYALRAASSRGARVAFPRALALALIPGVVTTLVLVTSPSRLLVIAYGSRYVSVVGTLRWLAVAMFASGLAQVIIYLVMGCDRVAWVASVVPIGIAGLVAILLSSANPAATARMMVVVQVAILGAACFHARRLLSAQSSADGAVLIVNWRDSLHPQGGGSEVFVEEVAQHLAAGGRAVTIFCAAHENAPRTEMHNGVRFLRRGSWATVYLWAGIYHVLGRFGPHDVVIDVQNAIPFFSPMYCGRRVVVLVHHLHREQWQMIFGRKLARAGWWVESRLAPRFYRRAEYLTVSEGTKRDLTALGIEADRISVVRNGASQLSAQGVSRSATPTVTYLGRLVPHKRIELLLEAAAELRMRVPDLLVRIVGRGPWEPVLRERVRDLSLGGTVSFVGYVDDDKKARLLAESWVLAMPSIKEGWGLVVTEAATVGTPTVGFRVGGLIESVRDGGTGLLADTFAEFVNDLHRLIVDPDLRERLGAEARRASTKYSWSTTASAVEAVLAGSAPEAEPALARAFEAEPYGP